MQSASALASPDDLLTLATPLTPPTQTLAPSPFDEEIEQLNALKPRDAGKLLEKMDPDHRKQLFSRRFEVAIFNTQRNLAQARGGVDVTNQVPWTVAESSELQNNSSATIDRQVKYLANLRAGQNRLHGLSFRRCRLCNEKIEWARMWVDPIATTHVECKNQAI